MVTRNTPWERGTPCWVDLGADIDKAIRFYGSLLGWDIQRGGDEVGGYSVAYVDGKAVAGIGPQQGPVAYWTVSLASDDVDADARRVTEAGGVVHVPPMDVMELGRMAIVADPTGAVFGLWQAGSHIGFERALEPGAVAWTEQFSSDTAVSKKFYSDVFGYTYQPVGNGYEVFSVAGGSAPAGGIGDFGPDVPAGWNVYFTVPDNDNEKALAALAELGGTVVEGPENTPFGILTAANDDQGIRFKLSTQPTEG